ncbi:hypothetical protein GP486_005868 [Trichoglossum hirsutum]|uniref:ER membrane protein complex subunit 4 n=1 Tax=Trichoglossum hirsutum TaxID=265104 RepID=A0A9P8RLU4_9PEZI|nr:hypothetical protein GP486_005868 [Trichoglossum hirsutum]
MAQTRSSPPPPPPNWLIDLNSKPVPTPRSTSIPDPPGYLGPGNKRSTVSKTPSRPPATGEETDTLKLKKAWEVAIAPAKQLPVNAIMMYMSGNSLQIFSVMMVFMLFKTPIQALIALPNTFTRFETDGTRNRLWIVKFVYVLIQLVALGLGIWKVNGMGLLP